MNIQTTFTYKNNKMEIPHESFWKVFKETNGAFSTAEAIALYNIAVLAPDGLYMELGTHKGKSAMSAIMGLKDGVFYLVDPIFKLEYVWGEVMDSIDKLPSSYGIGLLFEAEESLNVIPNHNDYSYVFVDSGSHGDGLPMQEAKLLEDRMVQGGIIAWHDYKNQFVEVEQAYNYLLSTGKYEEIQINWSEIFDYVKEHNLEEGNCSWHLYPELPHPPNFIGALRKK